MHKKGIIVLLMLSFLIWSCQPEQEIIAESTSKRVYKSSKVLLVVIDGPRFQETWGDKTRKNIPNQNKLTKEGTLFTNFFNKGVTLTVSGHSSLVTGTYAQISNNGSELAHHPSIFQSYLANANKPSCKAVIITSKIKLRNLGDTQHSNWKHKNLPYQDAQNRDDSLTLKIAINTLSMDHPNLLLVNFNEADTAAHTNDWEGYIAGIQKTDLYISDLWDYIQADTFYSNKTSLFITNDHGRHLDGVSSGFKGHGDRCEGCQHISLLALGPDFDQNQIINAEYELIDIAPTIASILNFPWQGQGKPISKLLESSSSTSSE